jgi:hypothetical protein
LWPPDHLPCRFLKNHSTIFRARESGQWGRCSTVWYTVSRYVKIEQAVSSIVWSADGHSLEFCSSYQETISINFDNFIQNKVESSRWLQENLHSLFPSTFPIEKLKVLHVSSFSDDPDALASLFERPENKRLLKPLINELTSCLLNRRTAAMVETLQKAQTFLKTFVQCFYGPNGVPPRAQQTAKLQHSPLLKYPQNLHIIDDMCCLGNPRAKQVHRENYPAFWALPEDVGLLLLIYLGVVQPIEIKLALQVKPTRSPEEMRHFIFTRPYTLRIHRASILWTGKMVNNALHSVKSNLPAEAHVHCHVLKAFLRKHFQRELCALSDGALDCAESTQPQQLALSKVLHVFFGLAEETECSQAVLQATVVTTSDLLPGHIQFACLVARHLIVSKYHLSGPAAEVIDKACILNKCLPFLYGPGKPWEQLGDDVLVEVTTTLIYAGTQPTLLDILHITDTQQTWLPWL